MLVMMFFNWRIYRTATKTTQAIRQGWTKVKGVDGKEGSGMGIHRGGSHGLTTKRSLEKHNSNSVTGGNSGGAEGGWGEGGEGTPPHRPQLP